ncbi:hypothetical protein CRG98_002596 [Punica granatum]|uniref:Uncharacterized protein n=1 Tax=Punica granatum TaxID=22663 RepID=A0A2I0L8X7_PUNGR|nr:hypothetical protein CRG98_002596 [Punica granatum]
MSLGPAEVPIPGDGDGVVSSIACAIFSPRQCCYWAIESKGSTSGFAGLQTEELELTEEEGTKEGEDGESGDRLWDVRRRLPILVNHGPCPRLDRSPSGREEGKVGEGSRDKKSPRTAAAGAGQAKGIACVISCAYFPCRGPSCRNETLSMYSFP